jgi:hypothetical protein
MGRREVIGIFIFTFLIILPLVSSVDFQMKSNYSQGETLLAKVSGNFIEKPLPQNILFYRNNLRASMNFHITEFDDDFYIYAQLLGKTPGNYSIALTHVNYYTVL